LLNNVINVSLLLDVHRVFDNILRKGKQGKE
jgi:hypothetical protein